MSGRDLIGIAKTGSGKTIAFLLPMFRHIMDQRPLEEAEGPICKDHIISYFLLISVVRTTVKYKHVCPVLILFGLLLPQL